MMTKMDGIYRKDTESKVGQSKIGSPINEFIRLYNEDPNQFVDATGKPISPAEKTAIDDFIQMLKDIGGEKFAKINSDLTPEQFDEAVHDLMDMVVKQINVDLNNYGIPLIELKLEKGQDNINPTDWADSFEKMATHFTNLAPTKTAMMKTLMDSYTMMITQMHQSLEKLSNLNTSLTR